MFVDTLPGLELLVVILPGLELDQQHWASCFPQINDFVRALCVGPDMLGL